MPYFKLFYPNGESYLKMLNNGNKMTIIDKSDGEF